MQLSIICANDSLTHVELVGRLDIESVNEIQDKFTFLTAARHRATLVDLSGVTFIGSLGMGMLVSVAKALHTRGAKMVLLKPAAPVEHSLRVAGIHEVIPIADAEAVALTLLA